LSDCDRFRDLLIERLYGPLDPADREALELHLAICEDCEAAAADYELIHAASEELEEPAPRAETVELLLSAAAEEAAQARKVVPLFGAQRKFLAPALAAAAVLVLTFGVVVMYERFGEDEPGFREEIRAARAPAAAPESAEESKAGEKLEAAEPVPFPGAAREPAPVEEVATRSAARPPTDLHETETAGVAGLSAKLDAASGARLGDVELGDGSMSAGGAPGLAKAKGGKGRAGGRALKRPARKEKKRDTRSHRGRRRAERKPAVEKKKAKQEQAKDLERSRAEERRRSREDALDDRARGGAAATSADKPARRYTEPPPPAPAPKAAAEAQPAPSPSTGADDDADVLGAPAAGATSAEFEEAAPEAMVLADEAPRKSKRSSWRRRRKSAAAPPPADAAPMAEQARERDAGEGRAVEKSEAITAGVLLARARERKAAGDCRGALIRYERIMHEFPGYRRMDLVLLEAAECHQKLGQKRKALRLLDRLDKAYPAWLDRSKKMRKELE